MAGWVGRVGWELGTDSPVGLGPVGVPVVRLTEFQGRVNGCIRLVMETISSSTSRKSRRIGRRHFGAARNGGWLEHRSPSEGEHPGERH